jgi:SAM-dependent methyltransferase
MVISCSDSESAARAKAYRFVYADCCNMCGAGAGRLKYRGLRLDRRQGLWPARRPGIAVPIFRCQDCALVFPNPIPLPEQLEQHYDVPPEEYWVDAYFRVDPTYAHDLIDRFGQLSGRSPAACTALDVGAGIGKGMKALAGAGFRVSGIEPSPSFRRAAIDRTGIPEGQLKLASVEDAEFEEDSFDFINFGAVVEHLADPARALAKATDWLKPGGLMYVEVPSSAYLMARLVRLFYRLTGNRFVINTCPMHPPYHLYEFGLGSFARHGARVGYSVAFHEYFPCAGHMPRFLIGFFNRVMGLTDTGMQLAVWLKKMP